jgi:hypothetical protein
MLTGRVLPCFSMVLLTSLPLIGAVGCKRDLGDCNLDGQTESGQPIDGPAAFDIAYRLTDGLPMYEGQALVQSTCGDGAFCHSPAATGSQRIGVPAGLNFDVNLACIDDSLDTSCSQPIASCESGQTSTPYCSRLSRLHNNVNTVNDWAEGMIQEIRAGSMPPGAAGENVRNNTPWIRKSDGSELPSIGTQEAEEIIRNWLACDAPVVSRTEIPPSPDLELTACASVDDEICVYNGPEGGLPDPAWSDIYWSIMFQSCVVCHGPANGNPDQNPDNLSGAIPGGASPLGLAALNLTGSDTTNTSNWPSESWSAVVNALAADPGACAGQGALVIPNDSPGSIMIQKMRAVQTCGDQMPLGGSISESLIQVVEEWIALGAPND